MAEATQDDRVAAFDGPPALAKDKLLLRSATISEQLARPFRMDLDLLSTDATIDFSAIVGKVVAVRLETPDGGTTRYFSGYVARFSQTGEAGDYYGYRASVVPWLWLLTRSADCAVFQDATVPDIIKKIFGKYDFSDVDDSGLNKTYPKREYCVQYRETDFNFVSRLMESEGIYYFFKHSDSGHTMVLCDASSSHDSAPDYGTIRYHTPSAGKADSETITAWSVEQELQSGKYVLKDFDFKEPTKTLLASQNIERHNDHADLEVFDYPGDYAQPHSATPDSDSTHYAQVRIEELQTHYEVAHGTSDSFGVTTGCHFTLAEHPRDEWNVKYLVTATDYHIQSDEFVSRGGSTAASNGVSCRFTAITADTPFRPARITPKPVVQGPQTAFVCGKSGTEIWTDKFGRVKIHFHWDRNGPKDESSSCWVRVAQVWAGKQWGGMFIPRVGHEVIVEFLEGDPDRPIITGRVYNGVATTPYDLPANATMSGIKTLSSKGGGGFNEIRFEDKKGSEQIFIHGEKNQDIRIKNDCFEWIGHDRHLIVKNMQFDHVEVDRHELVDRDSISKIGRDCHNSVTGKEAREIGGSFSLKVTGDVAEVFSGNHSEQVTGDYYLKADNIVIEGMTSVTIKVGQSYIAIASDGIKIGTTGTIELESTSTTSIKATAPLSIESEAQLEAKAPQASVQADAMLTLKGGVVMIN